MKKAIVYLFVMSLLYNIFQYMNATKMLKAKDESIEKLHQNLKASKDSLTKLNNEFVESNYFSLENNENALNYLEKYNLDVVLPKMKDEIIAMNEDPKGNKLVPYDQINGNKFMINKVKFLNHRWIIADFSDGQIWGEVIIKYFINADETFSFETVESIIYPNT
ncbi:hypothetical protein [Flavobacterium sp. '19STA2R22 D10 B1']|uniref:hypothetical protein n=1 Tax=Flavobacterium aerium TaxID=3037261 RepID=UPI00278C8B17|nr:hypothetical protein [Flavobacterium sp. '19STA2R22 D10 B1']